jgi:nucleotide-binding universal stress UspA family protein
MLDNILHASDFSEAGRVAFAHALKAALIAKSRLTLFHVSPSWTGDSWDSFPGVRETLEQWGLIPPNSPRSAVPQLGIDVKKVIAHDHDPVRSVLHYLDGHQTDLIVLAPHRADGRVGWFHKGVSEPIARKSGQMTLFVPDGVTGFVSPADGSTSLTGILIPVAKAPSPQPAMLAAARLVRRLNLPTGTITVLHVGGNDITTDLFRPELAGWSWNTIARTGDVTDTILQTADETKAGLIAMSTSGHHGFLDAQRGSTSEQVLRRAACPLVAVPENSIAAGAMRL